ncbi:phosphonate metabolism protein/1,5-bisphosphokinase (PRPP-forming) PhnN [Sedimentitalea todarodis]|uniref:ribose 1,5-bisphosphate phosphokinase n=1 Tax=Sedimentitalea todarodis TaxID=1631240 RepID=A0ABU3V9F8_9RHOB|nr:phosphonate metabolism protein/1,5-bisphosphokinase (PRPP-forming) PhnN [Sedimentitalea todarodis]MDU9002414.1 phosphonate metabolism protein/1,5-bisphosphokinase (PRPP-forming) PhnN [Sedimentitalea todarodis]
MSNWRLIVIVGPSAVGKDSVLSGIAAAKPAIRLVRRVITRAPELGGEDYDSVTAEEFGIRVESGAFCLTWQAHGLLYGIPADVLTDVGLGATCIANLSRSALTQAVRIFPDLRVLNITASPSVLASRLTKRGRESEGEIKRRLAQAEKPLTDGIDVAEIRNDGLLTETVAMALAALYPVRA